MGHTGQLEGRPATVAGVVAMAVTGLLAMPFGGGAQTADALVADRPDFTEATTTVGRGVFQIEFGYTFGLDRDDGNSVRGHSFGEPLLRAGVLAEWLELRVAASPVSQRIESGGSAASDTGMEDLYLGVKLALSEQQGLIPAIALLPQTTVPTGSDGFSNDRVLPGVNLLYSWDATDNLSLAGSTQVNRAVGDFLNVVNGHSLHVQSNNEDEESDEVEITAVHYLPGNISSLHLANLKGRKPWREADVRWLRGSKPPADYSQIFE